MTLYNKDQEYNLKVVNTAGETKEIKYTPNKDMSKPEMIMALKSKYKNFFKLIESKDTYTSYEEPYVGKKMTKAQWEEIYNTEIEHNKDKGGWETFEDWWKDMTEKSKLIESENTDIISKLNSLKDEFMSNLYRDKDKANEVKNQIKQVLQDAPDGTEMCRVVQDTSSGWTSHGSYSNTYTVIKTLKKENGVWEMYGRKKENLDDAVSSIVFNEGILMTRAEAEKEKEKQKVNDTSSHRDIVNVGKDSAGNDVGVSSNRVYYPNRKSNVNENKEGNNLTTAEKILLDAVKTVNSAYNLDNIKCEITPKGNIHIITTDGKDICTLDRNKFRKNGDDTELINELRNGGYIMNMNENKEVKTEGKIEFLEPRFDSANSFYKKAKVETEDNGDKTLYSYGTVVAKIKDGKPVVYDTYSQTTLRHIKEFLRQNGFKADTMKQVINDYVVKDDLTEAKNNEPVIVISYGRGTRFPDRDTAIRYYEDCVAGTDRNSSENYAYQNILYSLKSTNKPVVYDIDDDTEYDWWVQKGKPTEDISDELLKAHLGESKDMNEKRTESKELLDGIDSEEYAVNIRDKSTGNFVRQYDCYETYEEAVKVAKEMKLADNETYEIVKIMYDENGDELGVDRVDSKETLEEYLSDKDIKELDEYTDNEIKKMYDDYCSENSECKSFEEWQKENVNSAMINELEYEFFSNRKKTESSDIDEKVVTDGFVGQPLSMLLTYLGDGHDIADKDYDSVVFFPPVDEIDDADNYDLYVQGLSQILNVVEPFDFNDVVIVVNLADYVTANKDTLLDLFEVDGETDEEIMEDLVCRVMPSVISGYTTDNVYKILLSTVKGGK